LFFFQAEDGIRDFHVTGVQTCALPIFKPVAETGGRGQSVAHGMGELATALSAISDSRFEHDGVVLEHNLTEVDTLSVGQVRVARSEERRVGKEWRWRAARSQARAGDDE